jgi:DNA-binding CsgD family transcriptional regulator/tetratricopeptide (TPR) repeat protein
MDLLERDGPLQTLGDALREAGAGHGAVVLVSGEAGIGKSALVERFTRTQCDGARVLWGACDALFRPRPLGPLHDIAEQAGAGLRALLGDSTARPALLAGLLDELKRGGRPTVMVVEDAHWADEATLDLVKFVGRRIERVPALVIVTYRDDELGPRTPLRTVLGDLAGARAVRRLPIPALSAGAVRTLAGDRDVDAAALHAQTGGNPFFVTEVLAADGSGIPASVRDAVVARAARLSRSGYAVLEAAAVLGARAESWLLGELVVSEAAAADECVAVGMLVARGEALAFRHELARQAILEQIPPARALALHRLALRALAAAPAGALDPARLSHHAEAAADEEAVLRLAPEGARRAAKAGAHRAAKALYARALRFTHALAPCGQASLLEAYAEECAAVDDLDDAIAAHRRARELWRQDGDLQAAGGNLAVMATCLVRAGRNAEADEICGRAVEGLELLPASRELALAYRTRAHLRMLDRDTAEAIAWGEKAIAMAQQFRDADTLAAATNTVGTAMLLGGDARGRAMLEESLALAREAGLDGLVALAYTNLGSAYGERHDFRDADRYLGEGIAYASERDLDHALLYMQAWQALTHLAQGRWTQAGELGGAVVRRPSASAISRITALIALGRLRARRGDPGAGAALDEALALALPTGTLQRVGPVRAARAEAAWLAGDRERARGEAEAAWELAVGHRHPWFTGELAYWRWRAGERAAPPTWTARVYAREIAGDWRKAAAEWERRGCPYERARALAGGDRAAQLTALGIFDTLGGRPAAEALRRLLREEGMHQIPRGPRKVNREHPFGLTTREIEILRALDRGLRNAEIGERLHISPKTVDHHVSAVLAKLEVGSRGAAARLARERGLLDGAEDAPPK